MRKPYICFCGDEERSIELINRCKGRIRAVFITNKNSKRVFNNPSRYPALICLIFRKNACANDEIYKKIYSYCSFSRCPLHVIGSRRNYDTISRIAPDTLIQRSSEKLMLIKIQEICKYAEENPGNEFNTLKARFETVAILSDKASSLALYEHKISKSMVKPRIITASSSCSDKEYELIKKEQLSEIIADKPLNTNSIKLFEKASKEEIPAILIDRKERYGRKIAIHYLNSKNESEKITELLTEYSKKHSKLMYIRNK